MVRNLKDENLRTERAFRKPIKKGSVVKNTYVNAVKKENVSVEE